MFLWLMLLLLLSFGTCAQAVTIDDVKNRGILRHIGVPYANFITGMGDGLDVELMQLFAASLGVNYEFIQSDWQTIVPDLTGKTISLSDGTATVTGSCPVLGDVAASGITILPWRSQLANFSTPTFPTQVWLIARTDSQLSPIHPSGDIAKDIAEVRSLLDSREVVGKQHTCLDPSLYDLRSTGADIALYHGPPHALAPLVANRERESILLDVPDTLVALNMWPGQLKVIGPISQPQHMGVLFAKESTELAEAFDTFFKKLCRNGTYREMVTRYYPSATIYFDNFFDQQAVRP